MICMRIGGDNMFMLVVTAESSLVSITNWYIQYMLLIIEQVIIQDNIITTRLLMKNK